MGHEAHVDHFVQGARAGHRIDVWVEFVQFGIRTRWAVECKHWKARVPKEKVAAFKQIVDDVGADRGFLMTEVGFQPAGQSLAENTNVTLTSLAELHALAQNDLTARALATLRKRLTELTYTFRQFIVEEQVGPNTWRGHLAPGVGAECMEYFGYIVLLQRCLDDAAIGRLPLTLPSAGVRNSYIRAETDHGVVAEVVLWVDVIEQWVGEQPQAQLHVTQPKSP